MRRAFLANVLTKKTSSSLLQTESRIFYRYFCGTPIPEGSKDFDQSRNFPDRKFVNGENANIQKYSPFEDSIGENDELGTFEPADSFTRTSLIRQKRPLNSYTLSPLVEKSRTLRQLVDLGVDLSKLEDIPDMGNFLIRCDYDRDIKPVLQFLLLHTGMDGIALAKYLTGNPWIFQQDLSDLQTRVNYLESKKFSKAAIARIMTAARYWLNVNVEVIDERLGWFMKEFQMSGDELRFAVTKNPKLVTFGTGHVQFLLFTLKEEMGFSKQDLKTIILAEPFVYTSYKDILLQSFDFLHNTLKLSHQDILKCPKALRCYASHLKSRHEFLKSRRLDQYDAEKPNYISLSDLASGSDETFCKNVVKCSINEYNRFLKRR